MQPRSRGFPFFLPIFKGQIVDRGQVEKQLNRKSLLNIFSVYQQAIELVVMLIVFDRISSFLSIHTGVTFFFVFLLMQPYYNSNIYTTITLTFTLTIYLLTLILPIHAIHYNAILKQGLQEIRN